jgi:hypothetical protein
MTHQHPQLPPDGALIRRMDAYLSCESAEATAIIKDARAALQSRQPAAPADIRRAQIEAGEAAVVASLAGTGLRWDVEPAAPVAPVAAVPEIDANKCSSDVFAHGVSVGLFDIPKQTANDLCQSLTASTGHQHDWHYIAGRVHIKVLAPPTPPVQPASEALTIAVDALDEIALAGMSGSGQESEEGMRAWHARRAWEFIGIAARAKEAVKALTAAQAEGGR